MGLVIGPQHEIVYIRMCISRILRIAHFGLLALCVSLYGVLAACPTGHPWRGFFNASGAVLTAVYPVLAWYLRKPRSGDDGWPQRLRHIHDDLLSRKSFLYSSNAILSIVLALLFYADFCIRQVTFVSAEDVVLFDGPPGTSSSELGVINARKERCFWLGAGLRRLGWAPFGGKVPEHLLTFTVFPSWRHRGMVLIPNIEINDSPSEPPVTPPTTTKKVLEEGRAPRPAGATKAEKAPIRTDEEDRRVVLHEVRVVTPYSLSDDLQFFVDGRPGVPERIAGAVTVFRLAPGHYKIEFAYRDSNCEASFAVPVLDLIPVSCQ
jgi:hypothetical protein